MKFFNPFGPYILHSEINEESRKKTLDLILHLDRGIEDGTIKSEGKVIGVENSIDPKYEENSVSNGRIRRIPPTFGEGDIIGNMIRSFTTDYFEQFEILNPFCDDSGSALKQKEFTDCKTHEPIVLSAWYVMMESGDFQILHNHNVPIPHIVVSGAIYLDVPEDIKSPQGDLNFILDTHDTLLHNANWYITPKNGDVYVWPRWLKHFVHPFRSEEKRIMISFNSIWSPLSES